ncbi:MAG TPA: hypothetical protein VKA48_00255, partial [Gammaproteobacteria bacterium]|nr:hypothetical protein [Gammaproteobacteria bacterium]
MNGPGITRFPVFDRNRRMFGYEVHFPQPEVSGQAAADPGNGEDIHQIVGDLPAFVLAPCDLSPRDMGTLPPANRTVLLFRPDGGSSEALDRRLQEAASLGY